MVKYRPWMKGSEDEKTVREGERLDVRWADGHTTGHDCAFESGKPGIVLIHHDTKIWVPLASIEFRKIPLGIRPNRPIAASFPPRRKRD